jgi:hypothetical protein
VGQKKTDFSQKEFLDRADGDVAAFSRRVLQFLTAYVCRQDQVKRASISKPIFFVF